MDRSEYLETEEGQRNERRKRVAKRQYFTVPDHEPKSKTSITEQEKIDFQRQILAQMEKERRRAYRSPLVMEITFDSNQKDPPAVHTLAKNYMDLLQAPVVGSKIKRHRLLIADDRNIDVLIVNYQLRQTPKPGIRIKVDTVANFREDLDLIDRIRRGDFNDGTRDESIWEDDNSRCIRNDLSDALRDLEEWERDRAEIEARWGPAAFEGMHRVNLMRAQELHLALFEPKVQDLLYMIRPEMGDVNIDQINAHVRNMIVTPPFMLDVTHAPIEGAGKDAFKTNVAKALANFRTQHSLLFPLLTTVGVTIMCVPPKSHMVGGKPQYVDLDNLARYVIPAVHDVLKPPADTVHTFDTASITDDRLRKHFEERLNRLKRTPKFSITQYQMIRLPRLPGDPDNGFVRLGLCGGASYEGLWHQTDQVIERWET